MKKIVSLVLCLVLTASLFAALPMQAGAAETVTRSGWISALVETFSMTVEDTATMPDNYFSDITSDMGCYQDILLAVEFGVISLEAGEAFRPDDPATRSFAAETLNFCLNFQLGDTPEYTFSEAETVENPEALQVAVNRGWLALSGDSVLPDQAITETEKSAMLADAKAVLDASVIDENYESTYTFAAGVVVIPKTATVTIDKNYTVTASDYANTVKTGDLFVAYSGNIPVALKATGVTVKDGVTTISATPDGAEEAITAADSQGMMEIDMESFEAEEAELFSVTDTVSQETEALEVSLQSISYDKKTKTLKASKNVKLGDSTAGSISVEVSNLKLYHYESTGSGRYEAYITADTKVTKTISFDFGNFVGLPSSITLGKINIGGIGDITLTVDISLKGGMTETEEGVITAGFEYIRSSGFRLIKGYQKTNYSFVAEAEVDIGLTLSLNIDLVIVEGRIWGKVGVRGYYRYKDYGSGRPLVCETISAYLYANVGASVTINYIIDKNTYSKTQDIFTEKNSPVRVYYHYEDGSLVDECTRGKTNNETYTKYTTKTTSSYFNPAPSYAKGSYTDSATGTTTTLWTYTLDSSNNATITGYKGTASALAIPSKIDGYTVTKIGYDAFENNTRLRSVTIPDSVTGIGNSAFYGCTNLSNVTMSKDVVTLQNFAFANCGALTDIFIPRSLESAGENVFSGSGLKNVTIEYGRTKLLNGLFAGCASLETIEIPDSITEIGYDVFYQCTGLKKIVIPDTVTKVGTSCFSGCKGLTDVTLSRSMTELPQSLFSGCTSLKNFTIPDYITEMGTSVFSGCTALESVEFLNVYSEIPSSTFYNCSSLKEIVFPGNVKTIGGSAFANCISLEEINLPESLTTIGGSAFYENKALTEIVIPEAVTSIGSSAFYNCDALTKAEIKGSGSIGSQAFYDCDLLESITISDGVTSIGSSVCYDCDKLKTVSLGKGITQIPDSAFRQCQALETVTIPRFCKTIAANAFAENVKLTSAYVPVSVTSIQSNSFSYPAKMTMYGKSGSYAAEYAMGRSMTFSAVDAPITSLSYSGALQMKRYATVMPALTIAPAFDTDTITFASSDTGIATVSETGAVYGKNYGTATITATAGSGQKATLTVAVIKPADSVTMSTSVLKLGMGESGSLRATLSPADTGDSVKWTSSNNSVATVDSTGRVTAVGEGFATITASSMYGTKSASCTVSVQYKTAVTGFTVTPSGDNLLVRLSATELPTDAYVYVASYDSVGKMVDLRYAALINGTAEATIPKAGAVRLKAFLWRTKGMQSLVSAKEYVISN